MVDGWRASTRRAPRGSRGEAALSDNGSLLDHGDGEVRASAGARFVNPRPPARQQQKRLSVLIQGKGFPRFKVPQGGVQGEALYLFGWQRLEDIHLSKEAFELLWRRVLNHSANLTPLGLGRRTTAESPVPPISSKAVPKVSRKNRGQHPAGLRQNQTPYDPAQGPPASGTLLARYSRSLKFAHKHFLSVNTRCRCRPLGHWSAAEAGTAF
jgi:hypothetical protein